MLYALIDDNPISLSILESLVSSIEGARSKSFLDSEKAIEFLFQNEADFIVVDYSMPRITGTSVIKRLRSSPRHSETPIMMVTSSTQDSVRRRALELGATDFLNTPVRGPEFLARVKAILADN